MEKNKNNIDSLKINHKEFIRNNRSTLKTHQRFKSERYNGFTEETNTTVLSSNDDKRIQSIDFVETYPYEMSKDLVSEREKIKCNSIMKQFKK